MSDRHLAVLRTAARLSQRRLEDHDARGGTRTPPPTEDRPSLKRRAARASARVSIAQARRRLPADA